jgi:hypothetical protein
VAVIFAKPQFLKHVARPRFKMDLCAVPKSIGPVTGRAGPPRYTARRLAELASP